MSSFQNPVYKQTTYCCEIFYIFKKTIWSSCEEDHNQFLFKTNLYIYCKSTGIGSNFSAELRVTECIPYRCFVQTENTVIIFIPKRSTVKDFCEGIIAWFVAHQSGWFWQNFSWEDLSEINLKPSAKPPLPATLQETHLKEEVMFHNIYAVSKLNGVSCGVIVKVVDIIVTATRKSLKMQLINTKRRIVADWCKGEWA